MQQPSPDFVQRHWPQLIVVVLLVASLTMTVLFWRSSPLWLVYSLSAVGTAWNIQAYARGKSFHVSPGLSARAEDSLRKRQLMLCLSLCLYLGFTALQVYGNLYENT